MTAAHLDDLSRLEAQLEACADTARKLYTENAVLRQINEQHRQLNGELREENAFLLEENAFLLGKVDFLEANLGRHS